jgi:acetylornithine/succinyldiaminopimelate/putrescine aminotransferase
VRELQEIQKRFPGIISAVRGFGFMIGIEFESKFKAVEIVKELHNRSVLTVPAGRSVIQLLPALNLSHGEAEEGLRIIEQLIVDFAKES